MGDCGAELGGFHLRRGRSRQINAPQLRGVWELVERFQTEVFEEKPRRFIKQRTARNFRAAGDADQPALEQRVHHSIHRDAAHRLDVRARGGLAIGDEREGFERRQAAARGFAFGVKLAHPAGENRIGGDGAAVHLLDEREGALGLDVFDFQTSSSAAICASFALAKSSASISSLSAAADFSAATISCGMSGFGDAEVAARGRKFFKRGMRICYDSFSSRSLSHCLIMLW